MTYTDRDAQRTRYWLSPLGWAACDWIEAAVSDTSDAPGTRENVGGRGQCANTDPFLRQLDLSTEGSGPVDIVPAANSSVTNPPDRFAEAMSRADGCPSCVQNYQTPRRVDLMDAGCTAHYRCESCGHHWTTTWSDA